MNKYYELLMQFTNGTTPCRKRLLRKYDEALIDEAINLGYIEEVRKNDIHDPIYAITKLGKEIRDK